MKGPERGLVYFEERATITDNLKEYQIIIIIIIIITEFLLHRVSSFMWPDLELKELNIRP